MNTISVIMLILGVVLGAVIYYFVSKFLFSGKSKSMEEMVSSAKNEAEKVISEAKLEAKELVIEGKKEVERENARLLKDFNQKEARLSKREEQINKRDDLLMGKENELKKREKKQEKFEQYLDDKNKELQSNIDKLKNELEKTAGMTEEQARDKLIEQMESEAKHRASKKIKEIQNNLEEEAEKMAVETLSTAVQRYAGDYVVENTVTTIDLPSDEMKGRIIGREGRNIRAIEAVTGSELIIDDTPEAVVVSDFNPVRRETTAITLKKLILDGRIHPGRIESIYNGAKKEVEKKVREAGKQAQLDLGIHKLHPELLKLVGQLRYRTSYGQNVWKHSLETAFIAGNIAAEIGLSIKTCRRAGLLHDIGKAVDHEVEGSHARIGANLAEKHGESKKIVQAIAAHHGEVEPQTAMDFIIQTADALSGARPGARREATEMYIQRLTDLETIATKIEGVEKAFAIQAGRELRVLVDTKKIDDKNASVVANDISKRVEDELSYPGEIKIVVIRETRVIATAS